MPDHLLAYFKSGPDVPVTAAKDEIRPRYRKHQESVFWSLLFGYAFFYTCRLSLSVAKKPMLAEGVITVDELGLLGAGLYVTYAVGKFTNGFLADYANIRKFMSLGLFASAAINLAFGYVTWFWAFFFLWVLNGWFQSMGSALSVVSIFQWFGARQRGSRYGTWAGSHNIGEGMTFMGTALLVGAFGWRAGFLVPGLVCLGVAAVLFFTLADRPRTYGLPDIATFSGDGGGTPRRPSLKAQLAVLKLPAVWILGLSSACMYVARYAINSWGILYLQEVKGYSLEYAGMLLGAFPIAGLVGAVLCGVISDRLFQSRRNVPTLIYGLVQIGGLCLLFWTDVANPWVDGAALALFGFGIGGLIVFLAGLTAADIAPKESVGAVKGILGLFSYAGAALQEYISGNLIQESANGRLDFSAVTNFWIAAGVASMVLAALVWNAKGQRSL